MQELSIRFRPTKKNNKKRKQLNVGTLFEKALEEIQCKTLQILGFFKHWYQIFLTKFETSYPRKTQYEGSLDAISGPRDQP